MKRTATDESSGGQPSAPSSFPSLLDLVLFHIVNSFNTEASLRFYLALLSNAELRELILQRWKLKNQRPDRSLVCSKRRMVGAEITVRYVDRQELVGGGGGIISQVTRSHTLPIAVEGEARSTLVDVMLGKLQMDMQKSSNHRTTRYIIY